MIYNATYKVINGEAFIEGFETEEPYEPYNFVHSWYVQWLTTKKSWKVKESDEWIGAIMYTYLTEIEKQLKITFTQSCEQGIPLPKEISDRIEIASVDESYKGIYPKTPIMKFVQYAILNPTSKESLQVDIEQLADKMLGSWTNNKEYQHIRTAFILGYETGIKARK